MITFKFSRHEKVALLGVLLILGVLFISSSMTYHEQELHPAFIQHYLGFLERSIGHWQFYYAGHWQSSASDGGTAGMTEFVLRKFAHFSTYFALGVCAFLGFKRLSRISWLAPAMIWFFCIAMAAFDEYHQFLTGDRTPSVHDVMLDSVGALCGIALALIAYRLYHFYRKARIIRRVS